MSSISIGISACLQGKKVRYDGSFKRNMHLFKQLDEHITLESVCPEMSIGLGVPRETIRLVGSVDNLQLTGSKDQSVNHTDAMKSFAHQYSDSHRHISGFIGVKQSPSCGFDRVKRYTEKGTSAGQDAQGAFIQNLLKHSPLLPIEEDGRLNDAQIRENFITRVYTYHEWQELEASGITHKKIQTFWSRHKYSLMAHDITAYQKAGPLLANHKGQPLVDIANEFITIVMQGLQKIATRKLHANVLHHIAGYLKRDLSSPDKQELDKLIHSYRRHEVPLIVPMTMLKHHFKHHNSSYIEQQNFMNPYPENLALRNSL
jgi:uncharacterized protein YbgA (DUF1722 family)/uncharacterized protein YbbK (DUF523 family)